MARHRVIALNWKQVEKLSFLLPWQKLIDECVHIHCSQKGMLFEMFTFRDGMAAAAASGKHPGGALLDVQKAGLFTDRMPAREYGAAVAEQSRAAATAVAMCGA